MSPSDLALLSKWIELNSDTLLKYWEGEIDTKVRIPAKGNAESGTNPNGIPG